MARNHQPEEICVTVLVRTQTRFKFLVPLNTAALTPSRAPSGCEGAGFPFPGLIRGMVTGVGSNREPEPHHQSSGRSWISKRDGRRLAHPPRSTPSSPLVSVCIHRSLQEQDVVSSDEQTATFCDSVPLFHMHRCFFLSILGSQEQRTGHLFHGMFWMPHHS